MVSENLVSVSTMAADALVLKHQVISINNTDPIPTIMYPYYKRCFALIPLLLESNTFEKNDHVIHR